MRNRRHDIEKYLRGELSPAEMHALEKAALSDPFLAEALEGVEQAGADNFLYDLHKINRSVHDRMRGSGRRHNKVIRVWGWTAAVAATILLVAVSGFLVVNILKDQQAREHTMAGAAPQEDNKASADSLPVKNGATGPLAMAEEKDETAARLSHTPDNPASARQDQASPALPPGEQPQPEITVEEEASKPLARDEALTRQEEISERQVAKETIAGAGQHTGAAEDARAADDRVAAGKLKQKDIDAKKKAPAAASQMAPATTTLIRGKVTDENGHELPGVNVMVKGTANGTVTDGEGRYELDVADKNAALVFNLIGFESKEIPLNSQGEVNAMLEEDIATLSEVVVTGFSDRRSPDASYRSAEPDGGKNGFKSYLTNAVHYPQEAVENKKEGKVTIRFTVEPTGQLTDFEVVKGIGFGCEEELIRAIRQGPYWKPGTLGSQPVREKVQVRYKFQLPK